MPPPREQILEFRICTLRDKEAFGEFYQLTKVHVYRFILSRVGSPEVADDILGDVFVKACQYIFEEQRVVSSVRGLLFGMARYATIDYFRRYKNREVLFEPGDEIVKNILDKGKSPEENTEERLAREELAKILENLKPEYREVVLLRYIDDLGIEEIAGVLGKSQGAVRVLLHRAMRALKKYPYE